MSDSSINPKFFTEEYFNADELHKFEQLPSLSSEYMAIYQQVINYYHQRLMQDWVDSTDPPEQVPENHVNPPDISDWSRKLLYSVINNYSELLERKEIYEQDSNGSEVDIEIHRLEKRMVFGSLRLLRVQDSYLLVYWIQESIEELKDQKGLLPINSNKNTASTI